MKDNYFKYLDRLIELKSIDSLDEDINGRIDRLCDVIEDELYDEVTVTVNNNFINKEIIREEISDSLKNFRKDITFSSRLH